MYLRRHVGDDHFEERHYVCPLCDLAYCKHEDAMRRHFAKWHPGEPVILQLQSGYYDVHGKIPPNVPPEHYSQKALQHTEVQVGEQTMV